MKTHYAEVEEATESDNETWVWIACEPKDGFQNKVSYTKKWDAVDCRNCLRLRPESAPEQSKGKEGA